MTKTTLFAEPGTVANPRSVAIVEAFPVPETRPEEPTRWESPRSWTSRQNDRRSISGQSYRSRLTVSSNHLVARVCRTCSHCQFNSTRPKTRRKTNGKPDNASLMKRRIWERQDVQIRLILPKKHNLAHLWIFQILGASDPVLCHHGPQNQKTGRNTKGELRGVLPYYGYPIEVLLLTQFCHMGYPSANRGAGS